jgi:hypothetical protein
MSTTTIDAVEILAKELGESLSYDGSTLHVGNVGITLPNFRLKRQQEDSLLDLKYALPSKAHGDDREKLLYMIVQHASPQGPPEMLDAAFRDQIQESLEVSDSLARTVLADAIRDAYWTKPAKNYYPVPFHSRIPLSFRLSRRKGDEWVAARYKLFGGEILPFLCWKDGRVNTSPIEQLFNTLESDVGFSVVDRLMLAAAERAAPDRPGLASVDEIVAQLAPAVVEELKEGPFCAPALNRFQDDLVAVLRLRDRLPRRDLTDMLTVLLSMHLATYYYRLAWVLGAETDDVIRAVEEPFNTEVNTDLCDCNCPLEQCSLAARIRFRVGTGGDRPVSRQDGCAIAFREVDTLRLQPLAASIATANLLQLIWNGLGGPSGRPQLRALASTLRTTQQFRHDFDLAAAGVACVLACEGGIAKSAVDGARLATKRPGPFALREIVLASRRSSLKYRGRDVVNQLVKREAVGGILIRTRGNVQFFEVDEDMLLIFVAVICGEREIPYTDFLAGLRRYGLAPQDSSERTLLADALERLGMLRRYSDAGESTYVRYVS